MRDESTFRVKTGLAEMLKGGVIMDVVNAEQAKIAEDAGAAAVMALERVPADIRRDGGVARMSDPMLIKGIQAMVSIPVMAKARIGHFAEAQVLEALEIDYVDESEVLTPADEANHIDKWGFKVPFVCGATNLGEAALGDVVGDVALEPGLVGAARAHVGVGLAHLPRGLAHGLEPRVRRRDIGLFGGELRVDAVGQNSLPWIGGTRFQDGSA
jgi:hypothetical protein